MNELEMLKKRIEELERWKENFNSSSDITNSFQQALLGRIPTLTTTTKSKTSENIDVLDADGATVVQVLEAPDAFVEIKNLQAFADGKRFFTAVWRANANDPAN